jgi:lipoprotein-releasing system permease protein
MLKLFLWLRYLRKKKIVFLSITAVALSVSLLIVVASLFTGFIDTFEKAAIEAVGDIILIPPSPPTIFAKYPLLIKQLEQTESVEAATAMISGYGMLYLGRGNVRAVEVWGIEPAGRAKVTGFAKFLRRQGKDANEPSFDVPGSPEKTGGFVGIGVLGEPDEQTDQYDYAAADKMIGKSVVLTTGTVTGQDSKDGSRPEFKRQVMRFAISDIIETGVYQFDSGCVYLPIEELRKTLYPDEKSPVASQILIKLADNTDTDVALAVIRGVWRTFVQDELDANPRLMTSTAISTARQLQSRQIAAYEKQMGVLLLIFGVVSFGVVILVFCIFSMIVRLKQKDIAIIKSCGATSSSVAIVFVGFGACVGTVGSGIGIAFGYIITKNINTIENWIRIIFGLKLWKSSVYLFSKIPNEVNWPWVIRIVLMAIIAAAIGTLIPAIIAARTRPVKILRYE